MDEIKKDDVVQYITVDPGSISSKYKDQFGFVNNVGGTFNGKTLYSVKFLDNKIVYGIPEDCIRKATDDEARRFLMKFATKYVAEHNLLNSVTLTAGKLYSDCKFVAEVKEENKSIFKVGDHIITTRASWVIPAGTKGWVMDTDPVKGIHVCYKNSVDTPYGRLMTRWTDPYDLKIISLEEYDKRMVKKENNIMRFEDETIVRISGYPGFKSRDIWGVIKRYYGDGKYGVCSLSKPMENYGVFYEKYLTAYEEVMHDPERVIIQPGSLAVLTNVKCSPLCKIVSVSFEPNSRPEYELEDIDSGCEFSHKIYKEDFILVKPIKRNYKDVIADPTPTSVYVVKNYARPKKVIFHDPATIVFWSDGDKTIVKAGEGEVFDPEKGLAMAVSKKFLGRNNTKYDYYEVFKKFLPKHKEDKKND